VMHLVPHGPFDKVVQLLLLVPAGLLFALYASKRFGGDFLQSVLDIVRRPSSAAFLAALMIPLALFSVWMAYVPFEGIPKGGDEAAYYFQSKIYASGRMAAPVPEVENPRAQFPFRHFIFRDGKWFIVYTPFHSLLMSPFTAAGAAPLLGPLEGLLSVLGIYLLIRLWTNETLARICLILLVLSPFFLFMTTTFMAHNTNLMLMVWALYAISRRVKGGSAGFSVASGFLIGLAFTTKPYPVLAWMFFLVVAVITGCRKNWFRILFPAALAAAVPFALFLTVNAYYTGNPLQTGYDLVRGGKLIGFGPDKAWFPEYGDYAHTPLRGLINVARQSAVGSTILFGWPFLSLLPIVLSVRLALRDRRVRWLYIPLFLIAVLMWLHYCPAIDYGPRHYFTLLPIIILLSTLGLREAVRYARKRRGVAASNGVTVFVLSLFAMNLFVYIPDGIALRSGPWQAIDGMPRELAMEYAEEPAIIFMQAGQHGYPNICSGMNYNSPFLKDSEIIYCAHQTSEEDLEFAEAYSGRNLYLYWFDGTDFHLREWSFSLSEEITPTREMEYHAYLHVPDSCSTSR
ncbi:MAG: hypothetical protein GF388_04685, partial [Candidatus Aegiribacteria sp.]|nr:hypothetical protein [Candidatus Aegiribacteria sp.]MBD3294523.1 hypothetical protein [Candidatus Fermentibacteria bacterium]